MTRPVHLDIGRLTLPETMRGQEGDFARALERAVQARVAPSSAPSAPPLPQSLEARAATGIAERIGPVVSANRGAPGDE